MIVKEFYTPISENIPKYRSLPGARPIETDASQGVSVLCWTTAARRPSIRRASAPTRD